jgi:hypothetical protein
MTPIEAKGKPCSGDLHGRYIGLNPDDSKGKSLLFM